MTSLLRMETTEATTISEDSIEVTWPQSMIASGLLDFTDSDLNSEIHTRPMARSVSESTAEGPASGVVKVIQPWQVVLADRQSGSKKTLARKILLKCKKCNKDQLKHYEGPDSKTRCFNDSMNKYFQELDRKFPNRNRNEPPFLIHFAPPKPKLRGEPSQSTRTSTKKIPSHCMESPSTLKLSCSTLRAAIQQLPRK